MKLLETAKLHEYRFGMSTRLNAAHLQSLVELFEADHQKSTARLEGRTGILFANLSGIGRVAVKTFCRGGLASRITRKSYLNTGASRGQKEFEILRHLRSIDIRVPEPIAWADRGVLFCRTWLITRKVEGAVSLAALASRSRQKSLKALHCVNGMVAKMIGRRILHVDFHPGNILISEGGDVFLIDFDRAKVYKRPRPDLHHRYIRRWQRAVEKHRLPAWLGDAFMKDVTGP